MAPSSSSRRSRASSPRRRSCSAPCQRLHVPTLIFVNKVDRKGADPGRRRGDHAAAPLRRASSPMGDLGDAARRMTADRDARGARRGHPRRVRRRSDHADDRAPARSQSASRPGPASSTRLLRIGRRAASASMTSSPASTNSSAARAATPTADVSGRVFKIERTASGERVAYVRLFAGTLRPRQRVRVGGGEETKPTSIKVFASRRGAAPRCAHRGRDGARSAALAPSRVGDAIGEPPPGHDATARFPRPALEVGRLRGSAG